MCIFKIFSVEYFIRLILITTYLMMQLLIRDWYLTGNIGWPHNPLKFYTKMLTNYLTAIPVFHQKKLSP